MGEALELARKIRREQEKQEKLFKKQQRNLIIEAIVSWIIASFLLTIGISGDNGWLIVSGAALTTFGAISASLWIMRSDI